MGAQKGSYERRTGKSVPQGVQVCARQFEVLDERKEERTAKIYERILLCERSGVGASRNGAGAWH